MDLRSVVISMVKIAIVGAGGMGNIHYANYRYIDDCEVVAVVGTSPKDHENAKQWNLPVYETIAQLMQSEDIDVVDVCTPTFVHYQNVMDALQYKKHVICEKPLTLKKDLAAKMYEYAREQGCHLYVGHVVQFMKPTQILKAIVNDQRFGAVLDGYFERLSAAPKWAIGGWLFDKEKSGLIPFDLHIHDLDVIVSLFGIPQTSTFTSCSGNGSYPEQYRMSYGYNDKNIVAEAAWLNAEIPFRASWRVYFERGYLVFDGTTLIGYPESGEPIQYNIEETRKISTGINVPPTEMYLNELEHFIVCIKSKVASDIVKEDQVIKVIGLLEDIVDQTR